MRVRTAALLTAAIVCCGSATSPPLRLALVIGNGAYAFTDPLTNAPADAAKIAAALTHLGFALEPDTNNLDRAHLGTVIDRFGAKLRGAGPNVVSFFYYAGHAAQDFDGTNYLLPVDANAHAPDELRRQAIPVQPILENMDQANNDVNILVIDACRDWFKGDRSPALRRGLHDMGQHASVLIAYAASADRTSDEGGDRDSSPYSARLIEALAQQPQDPVSLLFDDVDSRVYYDTDSAQSPLYINGLSRAGRWSLATPRGLAVSVSVAAKQTPPASEVAISAFLRGLDRDKLLGFTNGRTTIVDTLLARRDLLAAARIDTPLRLAHFLAEISYETANFRVQVENLDYPPARLVQIFPRKFPTLESTASYAKHPERIANLVYASHGGNGDEASGDGWRYRGRGLVQIFGRANYERVGHLIGVDLVASPDLVNDPATSLAVATQFWSAGAFNALADQDDLVGISRKLGGPNARLSGRSAMLARARVAVGL